MINLHASFAEGNQRLADALATVFGEARPNALKAGDAGFNPWRQVEPAMAFMRFHNWPQDCAAGLVITRAYESMTGEGGESAS